MHVLAIYGHAGLYYMTGEAQFIMATYNGRVKR